MVCGAALHNVDVLPAGALVMLSDSCAVASSTRCLVVLRDSTLSIARGMRGSGFATSIAKVAGFGHGMTVMVGGGAASDRASAHSRYPGLEWLSLAHNQLRRLEQAWHFVVVRFLLAKPISAAAYPRLAMEELILVVQRHAHIYRRGSCAAWSRSRP